MFGIQCSKIHVHWLLAKHEVKMAGYWPRRDKVKVYKHAKKEQGKYLDILTKLRQGFGKFLV